MRNWAQPRDLGAWVRDMGMPYKLEVLASIGTIHNSQTGVLKLGGSLARTPGNYHAIDHTSLKPTSRRLQNTNESIHASVRVRLGLKGAGPNDVGIWKPKGLRGFTIDGVDIDGDGIIDGADRCHTGQGNITWRWRRSPWAEAEIRLPEDKLGDMELELLKQSPGVYESLKIATCEHIQHQVRSRRGTLH